MADCCFPWVVNYDADTFWDCCKLIGSHFGHDRAKNDSGVVFLSQAINHLCDCVYAVVGIWTIRGEGMGAWFA